MKKILRTKLLEYEKSAFLIELVKHSSGKLYVELSQTISENAAVSQSIKINPDILSDLLQVLEDYRSVITGSHKKDIVVTDSIQQKIQDWYLKGVPIKDLSLQLNVKAGLIEMILRNKGISIVSNEMPKERRWRRRKK